MLLAPDTEVSETIDGKLDVLLDEIKQRDIPVIYCLNRRKLGKAIRASMKQAAVAVYDADGAFDIFRKIVVYANTAPT